MPVPPTFPPPIHILEPPSQADDGAHDDAAAVNDTLDLPTFPMPILPFPNLAASMIAQFLFSNPSVFLPNMAVQMTIPPLMPPAGMAPMMPVLDPAALRVLRRMSTELSRGTAITNDGADAANDATENQDGAAADGAADGAEQYQPGTEDTTVSGNEGVPWGE